VIRFLEGALSLFGKYGSDVEKRAQEILLGSLTKSLRNRVATGQT
jgi:hypothetical protein